jgi:hypothetical protein
MSVEGIQYETLLEEIQDDVILINGRKTRNILQNYGCPSLLIHLFQIQALSYGYTCTKIKLRLHRFSNRGFTT